MYKQDYIEMREGVGQSILPAAIKVRRVGSGRKKISLYRAIMRLLFFRSLQKRSLAYRERDTL